jgi:ferritin-like metal-binding protein YciE
MYKYPKNWNKMTLIEQENWLVKKLSDIYVMETNIKQILAKIRGGTKFEVKEIERPDEIILKDL